MAARSMFSSQWRGRCFSGSADLCDGGRPRWAGSGTGANDEVRASPDLNDALGRVRAEAGLAFGRIGLRQERP